LPAEKFICRHENIFNKLGKTITIFTQDPLQPCLREAALAWQAHYFPALSQAPAFFPATCRT
jgi:hypothetical protein